MSLFISYTRKDEALVRELVADLGRLGRAVWVDQQIHGGESWWRKIIREIQSAEVFVFALSNASWRSKPCRLELEYAEKLGIPVLPVLIGPLESMFISLAEKQIIDYSSRSADAVVALVAALAELTAHPVVLPRPLPEPPEVPFEYLFRIASVMGPQQISPDRQEELVGKLRRNLKEEEDDVARTDIVKLLRELRERRELTVQNAMEIDEILAGVDAAKLISPSGGATRLPPADHWRSGTPGSEAPARLPVRDATESVPGLDPEEVAAEAPAEPVQGPPPTPEWEIVPDSPWHSDQASATRPIVKPPTEPTRPETGQVPGWLGDMIRLGAAVERKPSGQGHASPAASTVPTEPSPPATPQWWGQVQPMVPPVPPPNYPSPPVPRSPRFNFVRMAVALALAGLLIVIIFAVVTGLS